VKVLATSTKNHENPFATVIPNPPPPMVCKKTNTPNNGNNKNKPVVHGTPKATPFRNQPRRHFSNRPTEKKRKI
ncbi:hypothetical protein, partial [Stenotrophomonas maltophilia]|uniref:hypothetical protein n=1 Tax=Stenotrophomonas maltophilia TaxID=40324 RepID=UPI00313D6043